MIEDSADFFGAQALARQAEEVEPVLEDSLGYGMIRDSLGMKPEQAEQVAAGGGALGRALGRIFKRDVAGATRHVPPSGPDPKVLESMLQAMRKERELSAQARRVDLEALRQGGKPPVPIAEGAPSPRAVRGTEGEINLERHHPGAPAQEYDDLAEAAMQDPGQMLKIVRTADEMGDMLDVIARGLHEAPRTHEQIRSEGFDFDAISKALTQEGLATDRQLFALRTLVATLGEKSALLARKIYQGDHSPETLLQYEQAAEQMIAFTSFTKGQTREVARALSQQNMIAGVLEGDDLRAFEQALKMSVSGDPETIIRNASALWMNLARGNNPADALQGSLTRRTKLDAFIEWWKANNLSAMATQVANVVSGPIVTMAETAARLPAALIGEARHAMGVGSPEAYRLAEYGEALIGGFTGLRHSLDFFWHTLLTGESKMGAYGGKEVGGSALQEQVYSRFNMDPNIAEAVFTPAYRLMRAADEMIMLPAYMSELSGLAARDGISGGLSGARLARHVDMLVANPTHELQEAAKEHARKVVMQAGAEDAAGAGFWTGTGEMLHKLARRVPLLQFVFPWIKTPARIMDYMVESSVLATVSPRMWKQLLEGGANADIAAGKMVMGTAFTASVLPVILDGRLTGGGPENPDQRRAWEKQGWKPYSVRVGDAYISYQNWADPVVGLLAGISTGVERARSARLETDVALHMSTAFFSVGEYALESSYMEGFKRVQTALADSSGKALASLLASVATGVVPYSSAVAAYARSGDEFERTRSQTRAPGFGGEGYVNDMFNRVKEEFALRIPGMRDMSRPARFWDGTVKVPEAGGIVAAMTPFKMSTIKDDLPSLYLMQHGVNVPEPRSRFNLVADIDIELLDLDEGRGGIYDLYVKNVGEARRLAVETIINHERFAQADAPVRGLMLDAAISNGQAMGRAKFMAEVLIPGFKERVFAIDRIAKSMGLSPAELEDLVARDVAPRAITPESRKEIPVHPYLRF